MENIHAALLQDMKSKGIDISLSIDLLKEYNAGNYDAAPSSSYSSVPKIDGISNISFCASGESGLILDKEMYIYQKRIFNLPDVPNIATNKNTIVLYKKDLHILGQSLLARTGYGVLNGGSATSYADNKKNLAYGENIFLELQDDYKRLSPLCKDKAKGLTPAFIQPDGSPGPSFLLLKMRARLLLAMKAKKNASCKVSDTFLPLFQMTSQTTDGQLSKAYKEYQNSPYLVPLANASGLEPCNWVGSIQPLISAYSHSIEGRPKKIFSTAFGRPNTSLALPGGHGICFRILTKIFQDLYAKNIRFVYLGNVDNVGYVPDPAEIAALALSGKKAAFTFSLRSPMDVKGGVLVQNNTNKTIVDIGSGISLDTIRQLELDGESILFNCAIGLFDLDYLIPALEQIGRKLPVRFTDQDKEPGLYSQAEQITWEVAGLLPDFLSIAVDKEDRFIAAKLLIETILTSRAAYLDNPALDNNILHIAKKLHAGLENILYNTYNLTKINGQYIPQ